VRFIEEDFKALANVTFLLVKDLESKSNDVGTP